MTHNPLYAGLQLQQSESNSTKNPNHSQKEEGGTAPWQELKSLLLSALEHTKVSNSSNNNAQASVDVNVLECLGVLCNVSREFEDAANYLRSATQVSPTSYQLWNKLGATLANSNRSQDALQVYHEALSLKPKYARAWLNLAISRY